MFVGHVAVALAAKRARPELPLALLVVAAQGCDWLEVLLGDLARLPTAALWSHAVVPVLAGGAVALAAGWAWRGRAAGALLAALYLSHLPLDLVTGEKRLWPGAAPVGLRLYDYPIADLLLEGTLAVVAWRLYLGSLPPAARRGRLAAAMLALLLASQAAVDLGFAWRGALMDARMRGEPGQPPW